MIILYYTVLIHVESPLIPASKLLRLQLPIKQLHRYLMSEFVRGTLE